MYKNARKITCVLIFAELGDFCDFGEKNMWFCGKWVWNLGFMRFFNGAFVKNGCKNDDLSEKMLFLCCGNGCEKNGLFVA